MNFCDALHRQCALVRLIAAGLLLSIAVALGSTQAHAQAKPVVKEPPPKQPAEVLGQHASAGLASLHVYSTFGCLGLAADLFECKQYDAAKVQQIAGDVSKTSELAVEMLKHARAAEGKAADEIPYDDLIQCYFLLDREAQLLAAAAKAGDKESLQRCQQAREETWEKVKSVLGIEDPKTKSKPIPEPKPNKNSPEKVQP